MNITKCRYKQIVNHIYRSLTVLFEILLTLVPYYMIVLIDNSLSKLYFTDDRPLTVELVHYSGRHIPVVFVLISICVEVPYVHL